MAGPRDGAEAAARCFRGAIGFYRHDDRNGVLTMIAESLEDLPGAAVLHSARVGLLCALGRHAEAAAAAERAVGMAPGRPGACRHRALALGHH